MGKISRSEVSSLFGAIEQKRLTVARVEVCSFDLLDDEVADAIKLINPELEKGEAIESRVYLGRAWGADWYVSSGLTKGAIRVLSDPKWMRFFEWNIETEGHPPEKIDYLPD